MRPEHDGAKRLQMGSTAKRCHQRPGSEDGA